LIYLKQQLSNGEFYATFQEFGYSIFQYVIGALIFGLALGVGVGLVSYLILRLSGFRRK
jgi:hypothetical protein